MIRSIIAVAAALMASQSLAQDADVAAFQATGSWTAEFSENSCSVRRSFSHNSDRVLLEFRTYRPGYPLNVLIASDTLPVAPDKPVTTFQPLSQDPVVHEEFRQLAAADGWDAVTFEDERPDLAIEGDINQYGIGQIFDKDIVLNTGSLADIMQVLRQCEDMLASDLQIDAGVNRRLSRRVQLPENSEWLKTAIPFQMRFKQQGSLYQLFVLSVDEQGRAFRCRIVDGDVRDRSPSSDFCAALIKNARLEPALDANAAPVRSSHLISFWTRQRTEILRAF